MAALSTLRIDDHRNTEELVLCGRIKSISQSSYSGRLTKGAI
jgi:hypothetical protein